MGGIYLVPIPIAIPLILIIICLMPAIPVSWPFIIIHKIYVGRWRRNPGEKEQLPPLSPWREIAQDCRNWMMYSIIIPWISIVVLWLMCIAQILLLPYYLAWCAAAIVGLPVQIYELYVLFRAWCQQQSSSSSSSTEQQKQLLLLQQQQKVNDRPVSEPKSEPEIYTFSILPTSTSIRILTLQPSPNINAPLEGSLSIANLNTQPTYDALSYTWTTDSDSDSDSSSSSSSSTTLPRPCSINLHSSPTAPPTTLSMSSNCALALRRLRHPSKPRKLWIDAICINQSDLSERAGQVSLMARIFCSARKVVVYTGESDPETDQLYDWLNDLDLDKLLSVLPSSRSFLGSDAGGTEYGSFFGVLGDEVAVRLEQHMRVLRAWKERTQKVGRELWGIYYLKRLPQRPKEPADLRGTLRRYFSRRWFRRVWVLQEVSLPDLARVELLCGAKKTTGERGMHLLGMLMREREENQYVEKEEQEEGEMKGLDVWRFFILLRSRDAATVGRREEGSVVVHKRSHLLDILIETRGRECDDPRDKIFGVLNIARGLDGVDLMDENRLDVDTKVSYFDSVTKVYASYSALFIRRHGPGFFLALIKSEARVKGLPSWAADWTTSWPNQRALQGTVDFPAKSRCAGEKDRALEFDGPEKDTTGQGRMALKIQRPRIVRGFFAWTGQRDGDERIQIVEVKKLDRDEVLVEMYPGLAVLLRREPGEEEYYTFIRVCPHSLSKDGVERLVARWSRAVVYQENAGCVAEAGSSPRGYLGRTRVWKIV